MAIQYKQLKEIEKELLKAISFKNTEQEFNTITGVYIVTCGKKIICTAVTIDYKTKEKIEKQFKVVEEEMVYNPNFIPFREGPVVLETLKSLNIEPELIMIAGHGTINKYKLGLASYVGVMLKKPTISVATQLAHGILRYENIYFKDEIRGKVVKTKEFANPVYVSPGYDLDLKKAEEITAEFSLGYKLPFPLFLAHKKMTKIRKDILEIKENL